MFRDITGIYKHKRSLTGEAGNVYSALNRAGYSTEQLIKISNHEAKDWGNDVSRVVVEKSHPEILESNILIALTDDLTVCNRPCVIYL